MAWLNEVFVKKANGGAGHDSGARGDPADTVELLGAVAGNDLLARRVG